VVEGRGSDFSIEGVGSKITCSGTVLEVRFKAGREVVERRSFRGESPRSMLDVLKRTFPLGERGGVIMLSSGSSTSGTRDGNTGSEAGATEEVSESPLSLATSSVVFDFRKLTTRVFFLRMAWERECRPAPSESPVVAECKFTSEDRDGTWL
jgi:hypothetical protein